jgi:hypothetical protein
MHTYMYIDCAALSEYAKSIVGEFTSYSRLYSDKKHLSLRSGTYVIRRMSGRTSLEVT